MVAVPILKLLVGIACGVAALWGGVKHHGCLKSRLMRLFGKGSHGVNYDSYEPSKCQACLAAGDDFCISGNKCIPRATFNCKGPEDHITGDKEFSLHGNPEGIKHSMTCPEPAAKKEEKKDCYFDPECHAKVDWDKITKIKLGFFGRLKVFKEKDDATAVKNMMEKVHTMFFEAGMPDDRIDYILEKWVKTVYPEALGGKGGEDGPQKNPDCYFDKECHAKVDWKKIEQVKGGFFGRLKFFKQKENAAGVKHMMANVHKVFLEAGMPEDRIDYILVKWVKSVYPEALSGKREEADEDQKNNMPKRNRMCMIAKLRCMKDGEKRMDGRCGMLWEKCGEEIKMLFESKTRLKKGLDMWKKRSQKKSMCAIGKMRCVKDGEKVLEGRCGWIWDKCGEELKEGTKAKMGVWV